MSDVWGSGGLFERALANKLSVNQQNADSSTMTANANMMNAGTNQQNANTDLLRANQNYDLGLRKDKVDIANARTNYFGAETDRLKAASPLGMTGPMSTGTASNLGLRTFNPVDREPQKPMMAKGGVIEKQKTMRVPGYKNGGKVKVACKTGGKIGDVKKDDGSDKVDVVAREGEYFLNPETVAHIGGGNYEQGVRNLNQIVRDATGKEPGPTRVGESGKQGFMLSGEAIPDSELRPEFRGSNMTEGGDPRFNRAERAAMRAERAAAAAPRNGTVFVAGDGAASTDPNMGQAKANAAATQAAAEENLSRGQRWANNMRTAGDVTGRGVQAVKAAMPTLRSAAGQAIAPAAATVEGVMNVNDKSDFYGDNSVPTWEKIKQFGRDAAKPVATYVGGTIGAGAGMGVGSLATGAAGALGARAAMGYLVDDEGDAYKKYRAAHPKEAAAAAAAGEAPAEKPKERDFDAEVAAKMAESEAKAAQKPSLRDMYMQRLSAIDEANKTGDGVFGASDRIREKEMLLKELSDMEKHGVTNAKAGQALDDKRREDADKRIDSRMQTAKYNKDGKVEGYFEDPTKASEFRDYIAQLDGKDGKAFDFYALPKAQQDRAFEDFDRKYEMQRRLNERLESEGVRTSGKPRVADFALRTAIDPKTGKPMEIGIGDIGRKGVTLGDWFSSWGPDQVEKQMVVDPRTGELVAARHVVGNDRDMQEELMSAGLRGFRK